MVSGIGQQNGGADHSQERGYREGAKGHGGESCSVTDQIEGKENGEYLLLSKFEDDVVFEYHITVKDEEFNLGILTMKAPEGVFEADFDAE